MTSRITRSNGVWRKWRRPSRPSAAVVTRKPAWVRPRVAISRIEGSSSTRSTGSSTLKEDGLHAEDAADPRAAPRVAAYPCMTELDAEDAGLLGARCVRSEDEVAEAPLDEAAEARPLDRLLDVRMRADHHRRAGVEGDVGEVALARRRGECSLDAPMEIDGDDIGSTSASLPYVGGDVRRKCRRCARQRRPRVESGGAHVRVAEKANRQAAEPVDRGPPRGDEVGAAPDRLHPVRMGVPKRVRERDAPVIERVVVGDGDHVDACIARHGSQGYRSAAERVLLPRDRRATRRDRAFEVRDRDVGGAQHGRDGEPGIADPEGGNRGPDAVAEVDVSHRGEPQRAHAHGSELDPLDRIAGRLYSDGIAPFGVRGADPDEEGSVRRCCDGTNLGCEEERDRLTGCGCAAHDEEPAGRAPEGKGRGNGEGCGFLLRSQDTGRGERGRGGGAERKGERSPTMTANVAHLPGVLPAEPKSLLHGLNLPDRALVP